MHKSDQVRGCRRECSEERLGAATIVVGEQSDEQTHDLLSKNINIFDYRHRRLNIVFNLFPTIMPTEVHTISWPGGCMAVVEKLAVRLAGELVVEV